ncbi:uncharacterized protein LOC124160717 isoform X2 [Ischnura elegans]|nr:uncharacterized protein LOC124160717 isoform X2 [Ischnura elegans]
MMDNIEKALYGETHSPLPRVVAEECQQWKLRFPHLRVVGKAVSVNCVTIPTNDPPLQVRIASSAEGNHSHSSSAQEINNEENCEETYACHGTVEHEPILSHEFQPTSEPSMCHEVKVINEALVDELTKHVWKEVVEPKIKEFMEKKLKEKDGEGEEFSFCKHSRLSETFVTRGPRIERRITDKSISSDDTLAQPSQSAKELSHATAPVQSSTYEPIHRRHSDHTWLSHRKSKNRLAADRISEERDEFEGLVSNNADSCALEVEKKAGNEPRLPDINGFHGGIYKKPTQSRERLHLHSPSHLRSSDVTVELKQLEQRHNQRDISFRSRRNNERMENSTGRYSQSKSRHVKLPTIEDNKWSTSNEVSKLLHGRSSSALPKLATRNVRSTMSSYKNLLGERASSVMKHPPYKREISPFKVDADGYSHKFNRNRHATTLRTRKEKLKKERNSDL